MKSEKIIACHQPNFMPWIGFFAKMARADIFVLLDDIQFTQGSGRHNWTTRVQIANENGPKWLGFPVKRSGMGLQKISDIRSDDSDSRYLEKMIKTLEFSYRKKKYYRETIPQILDILATHSGSISETNIKIIVHIKKVLELKAEIEYSSSLLTDFYSNKRLIWLVKELSGTRYLSGDGAENYQLDQEFLDNGIQVEKMNFIHPIYCQDNTLEFQPGLSIIDLLCNVGINSAKSILLQQSQL